MIFISFTFQTFSTLYSLALSLSLSLSLILAHGISCVVLPFLRVSAVHCFWIAFSRNKIDASMNIRKNWKVRSKKNETKNRRKGKTNHILLTRNWELISLFHFFCVGYISIVYLFFRLLLQSSNPFQFNFISARFSFAFFLFLLTAVVCTLVIFNKLDIV